MFGRNKKNADGKQPHETGFRLEQTAPENGADDVTEKLPPDVAVFYEDNADQPLLALSPVALDAPVFSAPVSAAFLAPYLDELALFEKRWGYDKGAASRDEWCLWAEREIVPVLKNLLDFTEKEDLFSLQTAVVYLEADSVGDTVRFYHAEGKEPFWSYRFVRSPSGRCVADFFKRHDGAGRDTIALIVATAGKKVHNKAKQWKIGGRDTDFMYLDGLAHEAVAALVTRTAKQIVDHGACVGKTVVFPQKELQKHISPLLEAAQAGKIGVFFSKTGALTPMYASVSFVCPR